jgi:formate-nitrite transporter family protein
MKNKRTNRRRTQPIPVRPYRLLLPLSNLVEARLLLPLAEMIVSARQGELLIVNVLGIPEGRSLSESAKQASKFREALGALLYETIGITAQMRSMVRFNPELLGGVWELARQEDVNLILLGWQNEYLPETALGRLDDPRMAEPPCHVVAVRPSQNMLEANSWQLLKNILLPVRGGTHSTLTLRFANTLARHTKSEITLLHVQPEGAFEIETEFKSEFSPVIQSLGSITRTITAKGPISQAILKEARDHQILVMGSRMYLESQRPGTAHYWIQSFKAPRPP